MPVKLKQHNKAVFRRLFLKCLLNASLYSSETNDGTDVSLTASTVPGFIASQAIPVEKMMSADESTEFTFYI